MHVAMGKCNSDHGLGIVGLVSYSSFLIKGFGFGFKVAISELHTKNAFSKVYIFQ